MFVSITLYKLAEEAETGVHGYDDGTATKWPAIGLFCSSLRKIVKPMNVGCEFYANRGHEKSLGQKQESLPNRSVVCFLLRMYQFMLSVVTKEILMYHGSSKLDRRIIRKAR